MQLRDIVVEISRGYATALYPLGALVIVFRQRS